MHCCSIIFFYFFKKPHNIIQNALAAITSIRKYIWIYLCYFLLNLLIIHALLNLSKSNIILKAFRNNILTLHSQKLPWSLWIPWKLTEYFSITCKRTIKLSLYPLSTIILFSSDFLRENPYHTSKSTCNNYIMESNAF